MWFQVTLGVYQYVCDNSASNMGPTGGNNYSQGRTTQVNY